MDVKAVLVILAVLMRLLQASGQTVNVNLNIGGNTGGSSSGTSDKSQGADNIAELLKQAGLDTSQLETQLLKMTDTAGQNMLLTLLLEQVKQVQELIKNLTLDHCLTKKASCNKTLPRCPSGYEWFYEKLDMCYKLSTGEKNYTDAKSACLQAAGGRLAMPKDEATNDFLFKVKTRYALDIWIALTDQVTEGTWVWEDGTKLGTGWDKWGMFAPTQYNRINNCAAQDAVGDWFDRNCGVNMRYICEVKATV